MAAFTKFSESLRIGEDTFIHLDNLAGTTTGSTESPKTVSNENNELEVIDESPTSKLYNENYHRSIRERLRNSHMKKKKFKRNKSDSIVDHSLGKLKVDKTPLRETFSKFFDNSFTCPADELQTPVQSTEVSLKRTESNREQSAGLCSDTAKKDEITEIQLTEDLFADDPETEKNPLNIAIAGDAAVWKESLEFNEEVLAKEIEVDLNLSVSIENVQFRQRVAQQTKQEQLIDETELRDCKSEMQEALNQTNNDSTCLNSSLVDMFQISSNRSIALVSSVPTSQAKIIMPENKPAHGFDSASDPDRPQLLSNWHLPTTILREYERKRIVTMFPWQVACLSNHRVLFEHANLVYSAPTSAGKTLVSEILSIKTVAERHKKVLIILPFVAVVREKMFYLQDLLTPAGIRVEGYFGGHSPPGGFDKVNIAICTIEKANSIVNRLLEQQKLEEIGLIVIDEVHLIADPGRGYILELLLAKVLFCCRKFDLKIQIVTMSATLPNIDLLTRWLHAEYYRTDFRPVELRETIKIGDSIYNNKMEMVRELKGNLSPTCLPQDSDSVAQLCLETLCEGCSVIVFCPSKDWCEKLAMSVAEYFYSVGKIKNEMGQRVREMLAMDRIEDVKMQLKNCPTGLDSILAKTISYGCAFHHAGLTTDERDIIELNFRECIVKVIVATSTLSSGVNLPARRVIIRTPMFGGRPMNALTYKQMIGRAGRTGHDTQGESILICPGATAKAGKELVCAELQPLTSCLDAASNSHLKHAILEIIASGAANTVADLQQFINCTLLATEKGITSNFFGDAKVTASEQDSIAIAMAFLIEYEFIRFQVHEDGSECYVATRLGKACLASSMPPSDGFLLFSELQRSRQCFVLESELHAVYLVTPYSVCYQMTNIDWLSYLDLWERLPAAERRVGELVGIRDAFLVRAMRNTGDLDQKSLQIHKRFYTALALKELVNEAPICAVAGKYKCTRGMLQSLQQMAATFAGIVTAFCSSLNWQMLTVILSQFKERLFFGIHQDLIDLMRIPNMNGQRARALYAADLTSLVDLAKTNVSLVENVLFNCVSFESEKLRNGEDVHALEVRKAAQTFYVTGKQGMSVREAAKMLISDARRFLELEMGAEAVNWSTAETKTPKRKQSTSVDDECKELMPNKLRRLSKQPRVEIADEITNSQPEEVVDRCPTRIRRTQTNCLIKSQTNTKSSEKSLDIVDNESLSFSGLCEDKPSLLGTSNYWQLQSVFDYISIIDACESQATFDQFLMAIASGSVSVSVGVDKLSDSVKNQIIGKSLLGTVIGDKTPTEKNFLFGENLFIAGISFCTGGKAVYWLDLQETKIISFQKRKATVVQLFSNESYPHFLYDAKEQLKVLTTIFPQIYHRRESLIRIHDPLIEFWMLQPNSKGSLVNISRSYAEECVPLLENVGAITTKVGSIGLAFAGKPSAKLRSGIESAVTLRLKIKQKQALSGIPRSVGCLRYDLEMDVQTILSRMDYYGFPVDHHKLGSLSKTLLSIMETDLKRIYALCGKRFNVNSSSQVAKVLGLEKSGSTKKKDLEKLCTPLAKLIVQYRQVAAIQIKTIQPLLRQVVAGHIRGNSEALTTTGRITMHEPNMQNVAKDFNIETADGKLVTISCRSVFVALPKCCFISADYCQLELRILTHFSQDPALLAAMRSDEDVFRSIAAKWNHVEPDQVNDEMRNSTKQLCYGIIYGMGVKSLAEALNTDEQAAKLVVQQFNETYPKLGKCIEQIVKTARSDGYVTTLRGHRRFLPDINSADNSIRAQSERQAVNTTIQGSAADILKGAMVRMEKNLRKYAIKLSIDPCTVHLVQHLHDELIYQVPVDKAKQILQILKVSMENVAQGIITVPLLTKTKIGDSWGGLEEHIFKKYR